MYREPGIHHVTINYPTEDTDTQLVLRDHSAEPVKHFYQCIIRITISAYQPEALLHFTHCIGIIFMLANVTVTGTGQLVEEDKNGASCDIHVMMTT